MEEQSLIYFKKPYMQEHPFKKRLRKFYRIFRFAIFFENGLISETSSASKVYLWIQCFFWTVFSCIWTEFGKIMYKDELKICTLFTQGFLLLLLSLLLLLLSLLLLFLTIIIIIIIFIISNFFSITFKTLC